MPFRSDSLIVQPQEECAMRYSFSNNILCLTCENALPAHRARSYYINLYEN